MVLRPPPGLPAGAGLPSAASRQRASQHAEASLDPTATAGSNSLRPSKGCAGPLLPATLRRNPLIELDALRATLRNVVEAVDKLGKS